MESKRGLLGREINQTAAPSVETRSISAVHPPDCETVNASWKREIQRLLADQTGFTITIAHLALGEQWSKIERGLFAYTSQNWRENKPSANSSPQAQPTPASPSLTSTPAATQKASLALRHLDRYRILSRSSAATPIALMPFGLATVLW
jgi:hypothetical protein